MLTVLIFILTLALALAGAIGAGMALRRALARVSLSGVLGAGVMAARRRILAARERDLALMVRGLSDCALVMLTFEGRVASWNAGARRIEGYDDEEALGMALARFYRLEDRAERLPQRVLTMARTTGHYFGEGYRLRRDGTTYWAHVAVERILDARGHVIGFASIVRDMTRFKADQERLAAQCARRDDALEGMHQGLALFDDQGRLVFSNARLAQMWGLPADAFVPGMAMAETLARFAQGRPIDRTIGGTIGGGHDKAQAHEDRLRHALATREGVPCVLEWSPDFVVSVASRPLAEGGWVSTFEDITLRHRAQARMAWLVGHDALTGLPNRRDFVDWCAARLAYPERGTQETGTRLALVRIDLVRFRQVHERRGQGVAEALLVVVAQRLRQACGRAGRECVARLDRDQFVVAALIDDGEEALGVLLGQLQGCFVAPFALDGQMLAQQARFGVSVSPADGTDVDTLLGNTELAIDRAKASFGEAVCHFCPDMDEVARRQRRIATDLRHAVERGELHLLYQPQHALEGGTLLGYEALVRWIHPEYGLISPVDFIPMAEQSGDIFAIGEWVLNEAARAAAQWDDDLKIAVNLSPVQLQQEGLVQMITGILIDSGLPARRLELEITEGAIIADRTHALHVLRQIKALGISIALDDFGTGYSSLDTLGTFPIDKIKIDKSFLLRSAGNVQAATILRAVLALGRSLDIPVLAEGVETRAHLDLLRDEGCAEGQGYLFGRPAPLDDNGRQMAQA